MPAQRKNLVADKGATFAQPFRYKDSDGNAVDLTGYTATFALFNVGREEPVFTKAAAVDSVGTILVHVTDEETTLWAAGKYAWRLELGVPNGDITRLMYGSFDVRSGVDV